MLRQVDHGITDHIDSLPYKEVDAAWILLLED